MSMQNNNQESKATVSIVETIYSASPPGPVCVADGQGLSVRVDRGHLIVADGIGRHRRERRYHKATHGLTRLVILGSTGTLSLDALRYCDRLGIAVVVIDPGDVRPSFMTVPKGTDDARLRRVQAAACDSGLDIDVSRLLLGAKLEGQTKVIRGALAADGPADSIDTLREQLVESESLDEIRQLEASAAACYFNAWGGSPLTSPKFIAKDILSVPDHWLRYDGRRSVLHSNNGNRKAERPVNAILNYLFALLEVEAIVACEVVGLDPGLGMMHADARGRQSMALDLMEPVRPLVEAWTLNLLTQRTFKKSDFAETPDGHVRLLAPLTHELAGSMSLWRKGVAPWAEKVSHLLGEVIRGRYQPVTPLTGDNYVRAQREVNARKTQEAIYRDVFTREGSSPKQRVKAEVKVPLRNCSTCGGQLLRGQHVNCPSCWELHSGQEFYTRKKRGEAISRSREEERRWREVHPSKGDHEVYRREILPGLEEVTLSRIMDACGVAKSTASAIRSGKRVPTERHWEALRGMAQEQAKQR
jgi:CRISPR-associated endonuclease Cas1